MTEQTAVEQCDRDAVERAIQAWNESTGSFVEIFAQHFARHRLNTRADDGWREIASAPKDGTWFLGYWPDCSFENRVIATKWYNAGVLEPYWLDAPDRRDWTEPTHWRPLPDPPAKADPAPQDKGAGL